MAEGIPVEKQLDIPDVVCRCKVAELKSYTVLYSPVQFKIVLNDCCKNRMGAKRLPIVNVLQRSETGVMEEEYVEVEKNSNGTYTVFLWPHIGGKLEIHVRVTEAPIEGSPFKMRCRNYEEITSYKYGVTIEVDDKFDRPQTIACGQGNLWAVCNCTHVYIFRSSLCVNKIPCPKGDMQFPAGLHFSGPDRFYMSSSPGSVVQEFDVKGKSIQNFDTPQKFIPQPQFACPSAIVAHEDKIYTTDPLNKKNINVFQLDGKRCATMETECIFPTGLAISKAGHLLIADHDHHCIHTLALTGKKAGKHLEKFADRDAGLVSPEGIATDAYGFVLVCSSNKNCIVVFEDNGRLIHTFGGPDEYGENATLLWPIGIAVDDKGKIYVTDRSKRNQILVY